MLLWEHKVLEHNVILNYVISTAEEIRHFLDQVKSRLIS